MLGLEDLETRRKIVCLDFARKCVKKRKISHMFPNKTEWSIAWALFSLATAYNNSKEPLSGGSKNLFYLGVEGNFLFFSKWGPAQFSLSLFVLYSGCSRYIAFVELIHLDDLLDDVTFLFNIYANLLI